MLSRYCGGGVGVTVGEGVGEDVGVGVQDGVGVGVGVGVAPVSRLCMSCKAATALGSSEALSSS